MDKKADKIQKEKTNVKTAHVSLDFSWRSVEKMLLNS